MPTIEVGLDPRGMEAGARRAKAALGGVAAAAHEVERGAHGAASSFDSFRKSLTTGADFVRTSRALGDTVHHLAHFDSRRLAGTFSVLLNDVGLLAGELQHLSQRAGGAKGILESLFSLAARNPLVTLVSVAGSIAGAMSYFSRETEEATDSLQEMIDKIDELSIKSGRFALAGIPTASLTNSRASQLQDVFNELAGRRQGGGRVSLGDVGDALGIDRDGLAAFARERFPAAYASAAANYRGTQNQIPGFRANFEQFVAGFELTAEQIASIFRDEFDKLALQAEFEQHAAKLRRQQLYGPTPASDSQSGSGGASGVTPTIGVAPPTAFYDQPPRPPQSFFANQTYNGNLTPNLDPLVPGATAPRQGIGMPLGFAMNNVYEFAEFSNRAAIEAQKRATMQMRMEMRQMRRDAEAVATTLANGILAFANGAQDARGLLQGIVSQMAAIGMRRGIMGIIGGQGYGGALSGGGAGTAPAVNPSAASGH